MLLKVYEYLDFKEFVYFKYPVGVPVEKKNTSTEEEKERVALARAKKKIRDYALCNDFQYFCTFTLAKEMPFKEFQRKLSKTIKNYNFRNNKSIQYVLVFEKGDKNDRLHAHGLITELPPSYKNEHGYQSCYLFDKFGYQSFSKIKSREACAKYVTTYMSSAMIYDGQRYLCSQGLKTPVLIHEEELPDQEVIGDFENDYVIKIRINN